MTDQSSFDLPHIPRWLKVVRLLVLGPVLWAIFHVARTRPLEQYMAYTWGIAAPLYFLLAFGALAMYRSAGTQSQREPRYRLPIASTVLAPLLYGVTLYSVGGSALDLYEWFKSPTHSKANVLIGTAIFSIYSALSLFLFRLYLRSLYGLTEAIVGIVVILYLADREFTSKGGDLGFYLTFMTGGIYLIVRGFDNIHQGLTREPLDPIAKAALPFIKLLYRGSW